MTLRRHSRVIVPALLGMTVLFGAQAGKAEEIEKQQTPSMTCAAVQNLIRTRGAMVLYTGPHLYDRYVEHLGFCPTMMRTQAAWVPTRDNPQCFIGYTCEQQSVRPHR